MEKIDIDNIRTSLINSDIDSYHKKVIISTLNNIKDSKKLDSVTRESVLEGLKEILGYLENADATIATGDRIQRELSVIDRLKNVNASNEDIIEASFELDCLYYEMGIPPRETDTIAKYLELRDGKCKNSLDLRMK